MSHRKYEAPRHGSLGFLPRKRTRYTQPHIKSWPKDDRSQKPHFTAFLGYKAGMTHVVRDLDKPGSKMHKKEVVDAVTIIECPPMVVVGIVGYAQNVNGLRAFKTLWADHLDESMKRRLIKHYRASKARAIAKGQKDGKKPKVNREAELKKIKRNAVVVRVIAHTQPEKIPSLHRKRAHACEIQINGGTIEAKVDFAYSLFEKKVPVDCVFAQNELIDIVTITKGKGFKGVIRRFGTKKLPRKSHKGLRKVACIGAWHPERVAWTVARAGQMGHFHRIERNKKVFRVGKSMRTEAGQSSGSTEYDLTQKTINPVGGFPNYGLVRDDWIMVRGSVGGPKKGLVAMRKPIVPQPARLASEKVTLKFIDTSSKMGRGRFQTLDEKRKFVGFLKKDLDRKRAK